MSIRVAAIFFISNCVAEVKKIVHDELQIETEALGERYLGLPMEDGSATDGSFSYLQTE